jgi:cytochrome b561
MPGAAADMRADAERTDAGASPHYHPIGIFFHWLMAVMVFAQLFWGWRTSQLAAGFDKADAYVVHAQLGAAILLAAILRLGWRLIAPFVAPRLEAPEDLPGWQKLAAEATHWALYALMIALPVSGLLMLASTAPATLRQALGFDGFAIMGLVQRARIEHAAETIHFVCVWFLTGLVAIHVGAALKHHFIDRDDVLARMAPFLIRGRPEPDGATQRTASAAKAAR